MFLVCFFFISVLDELAKHAMMHSGSSGAAEARISITTLDSQSDAGYQLIVENNQSQQASIQNTEETQSPIVIQPSNNETQYCSDNWSDVSWKKGSLEQGEVGTDSHVSCSCSMPAFSIKQETASNQEYEKCGTNEQNSMFPLENYNQQSGIVGVNEEGQIVCIKEEPCDDMCSDQPVPMELLNLNDDI